MQYEWRNANGWDPHLRQRLHVPGRRDVASEPVNLGGSIGLGAYGHSRMRSLIIGSTTTEMVRSCRIPVMLFR